MRIVSKCIDLSGQFIYEFLASGICCSTFLRYFPGADPRFLHMNTPPDTKPRTRAPGPAEGSRTTSGSTYTHKHTHTTPPMTLNLKPLHPSFAAEARGIDFSKPVPDHVFQEIRDAMSKVPFPHHRN
jgi:hypothetical protein